MLEPAEGRRRCLELARQAGSTVSAVLCTSPENIYFFTGFRTMLYTRFVAALICMDQPEEPILIAASVDERMVCEQVWSPPFVERITFHGPDHVRNIVPTPADAMAPH